MTLAALDDAAFVAALASEGLSFRTGPFVCRLSTRADRVSESLKLLYGDFPVVPAAEFADFPVQVRLGTGLRRWYRPQSHFIVATQRPFLPLPADQAFPLLEWGLNWCVSNHCHQYLMLHSAVVERFGRALILPAPPGSGKSTLAAALVLRGWRLLSDELGLVRREGGLIDSLARPVSLKNSSLPAIRAFAPESVMSTPVHDTSKGTVAHLKPPADSVARMLEPARAGWIVLPRYTPGASAALEPLDRAEAFMALACNSFNYGLLGQEGFNLLARVVDGCQCYRLRFDNLDQVTELLSSQLEPMDAG